MKLKVLGLAALLLFFGFVAEAQNNPWSDIRQAETFKPSAQQCTADLAAWNANDDAQKDEETWWTNKLTTVELYKMQSEASSCPRVLLKVKASYHVPLVQQQAEYEREVADFHAFELQFTNILLSRAERVLTGHGLSREYFEEK